MLFRDREDGATHLLKELVGYKGENAVVLAIPRGGVPVGYVIAKELHLPMELALSKKIGHPMNKEYAIGSVTLFGSYVNPDAAASREYIELETMRTRNLLAEKHKLYMGSREPLGLRGMKVIITDDGIATGSTVVAMIRAIELQDPAEIIVAAPVAAPWAVHRLKSEGANVICAAIPEIFGSVGEFYEDFSQVDDETVIELLRKTGSTAGESS